MKKTCKVIFIPIIFICCQINLFAFDGYRKGLIAGLSLGGAGFLYNSMENISTMDSTLSGATDIFIGYAPSNQLEIYLIFQYHNLAPASVSNAFQLASGTGSGILNFGILGPGISYHFVDEKWKPNLFVTSSLGRAAGVQQDGFNIDALSGYGGSLGFGYEFIKHFDIRANVLFSGVSESSSDDIQFFSGASITIGGTAF